MTVLVTGAKGMIGSALVQGLVDAGYSVIGVGRSGEDETKGPFHYIPCDLGDKGKLREISKDADRIIHLAALAHSKREMDLSWERYKYINVDCAKNVFEVAGERPVLFISTVDVYGFYDGKKSVNSNTEIHPVTKYGKSKAMAEEECKKLPHYTIFRFSPVYTDTIKRDIQKRYYLKYPTIAYQVGSGSVFEILNIDKAVAEMVAWCGRKPENEIQIIKDNRLMWTPRNIQEEKDAGRANLVLRVPRWMVNCGYIVLKRIMGENEKTYLLNKAVHPLRTSQS